MNSSADRLRTAAALLLCNAALAPAASATAAEPCTARRATEVVQWTPAAFDTNRRVLRVGPGQKLSTPGAAARVARDGDVVLIEAAEYRDQRAVWPQDGLLIRGVNGRPRLVAGERLAQAKAIWVVNGDSVIIENFEFSDARNGSHNGAGIRAQGARLTVRASFFHDSDMGILTSNEPDQELVVEHTEFARNGHANGKAHNLYVGAIKRFEMRFSYSHESRGGHLLKSRARENLIEYNRLDDGRDGVASYEIDLSRSNEALVLGNVIVQSAGSPNSALLSYGAEDRGRPPLGRLAVAHNTFYSFRTNPIFVFNHSTEPALVVGNLYSGARGTEVRGPASLEGNQTVPAAALRDPQGGNFAPKANLQDKGTLRIKAPAGTTAPIPRFEYLEPLSGVPRVDPLTEPGALSSCQDVPGRH